ncbi:sphingosine-1-phosphate lyase 1 isoform X2 [Hydra vulgaris]|uniref:sphinganine-1-phosphate aldolase n=2 Tax=Hydra vulgaris TaxID=6087 RepID=A0ABM4BYP1_HYDVU
MAIVSEILYDKWILLWESFLQTIEPHLPEHLHWNELCWTFVYYMAELRLFIHSKTRGLENWEIVVNTAMVCFGLFVVLEVLRILVPFVFFNDEGFFNVMKRSFFKKLRCLPFVGTKIQHQIDKTCKEIEETSFLTNGLPYVTKLPLNGLSPENIQSEIKKYKEINGDDCWMNGYVSGTVYSSDNVLSNLMTKVYAEYIWSNPLHSDVFPDVRKMEAEIVSMCINMYNGTPECCGMMTSGGTESILMAVKCYREIARERGIRYPEIIAPVSAHPAFDKACQYFGIKLTHIPVDKKTGKANVKLTKKAIGRRTILLVGSVPSYPHGCIDPIEELATLAQKYKIFMHADCCLGGFLVPFMKKAGFQVPAFDFSVAGITSISIDTHKYGYSPKGSSVILYRNKEIRSHQYFTQPNWTGGVYASASMPGSRPGSIIATTWAAMMYHGEKGYIESTRKIISTAKNIGTRIERIPGIKLMSAVDVSVVSFTSDIFDIFLMSNELKKKKWHLNPLQFPSGIHIAITMRHTKDGVADRFVNDIKEVAARLMKNPFEKAEGQGAIYGLSQQIPDRSIITEITTAFLDSYYSVSSGLNSKNIQKNST